MKITRTTLAAAIIVAVAAGVAFSVPLTFTDFVALGRVSDPQISPDGKTIVYVCTWQSVEENSSNSDIFSIPFAGGEARRLTNRPDRDNQPRFSPDGRWIAFTSSRSGTSQIWLLPTDGGEATQLTRLSTGASSPAWTPDGKQVIFRSRVFPDCKDDACNKERLAEEEKKTSKAGVFDELFYVHWDHWRDERRTHVFVVPVKDGEASDLTPGGHEVPTEALGSTHDVAVSPDGKEICVVVNTDADAALSINNDLFVVPMAGGAWSRITDNPANDNHPVYSPDGRWIAYRAMSRAGFEADQYRIILYDRNSGERRDAAPGLAEELDRSPAELTWSTDSKSLYATCEDQGYRSIYEINASNGKVKQLSQEMYARNLNVSPDGKNLVFLRQSAMAPFEVVTANRSGKNLRQVSHVNEEALAAIEMNPLESFWFEGAGGDRVHGWLLKPPGFDSARKWPLVFLVHGGPQGAWSDGFHERWNMQMFAAPGNVVVAINPRGSTGYGQRFTDEITGDWGGKVYEDLMKGLDYALENYDFIDSDRVASAGASYGGYMMNWFEGHTDRFKCLVNHDGVYNLESMYGATEELWFPEWEFGGTPWSGSDDYEKWSPHKYAANFKTPMLVVHGGLDFRVPLGEGMQVFTALQRQGVPSKFLYFPDEGHWVLQPQNAELWWGTVLDWIGDYIGEEGRSGDLP